MDQTTPAPHMPNPFPPGETYSPAPQNPNPFPPSPSAPPMARSLQQRVAPAAPQIAVNPLAKHFRQPAIYMTLPSKGNWWAEGSLDMPVNQELAVYPMTSRDEITLRTPDALINGQGVVDVIHSCVPSIKNAWKMPSVDVDATLISMRIASYGHSMDFDTKCPHCGEENTYGLDLRKLLESIKCPDFDKILDMGVIAIKFRPQSYLQTTQVNQMNFQLNQFDRMINSMGDDATDERSKLVAEQVIRLNDMGLDLIANATEYIIDSESQTKIEDNKFIREFYGNIDSHTLGTINDWMSELVKDSNIKPQNVDCANCGKEIKLEIMFDYANFFVTGF